MKNVFRFLSVICFSTLLLCCKKGEAPVTAPLGTDSFRVTVTNGYGSGLYKAGDTVHIFCNALADDQVFSSWSGSDVSLLNAANEWHTWFIMPEKSMSITANTTVIPVFALHFEQIKGQDSMKPVYYYFPAQQKGIVYLLHGTGGSAATLTASYEWQVLMRDLVHHNFAVIITEAEESTVGADLNQDGKIRWNNLPWDTTTNVDFANIRIITNSFISRGMTDPDLPRYAVGMSNGGNFAASLATIYHFRAAVSYCAPSGGQIARTTTTPIQFCMARFDANPNVGSTGNASALQNSQTLTGRGICSRYLIKEHSPLYPERFARRGDISIAQSTAVFEELQKNGFLDAKNYFKGYADDLKAAYQANPSSFPQLNDFSISQQLFVFEQISLAVSDHHMYSDYDNATVSFLDKQCR